MLRRVALATLIVVGSALLVAAGVYVVRILNPNVACALAGSREASDALGRTVDAKRSPLEGFFESCEYYPPGSRLPIAGLAVHATPSRT